MKPNADSAFAFVGNIGGVPFKLLRHHKLDAVVDGTEHETVDVDLLAFCLRMIDQVPVSSVARATIREHLKSHASFWKLEVNEEEATLLLNQQDDGCCPTDDINRIEVTAQPEPAPRPEGESSADPVPPVVLPTKSPEVILASSQEGQQLGEALAAVWSTAMVNNFPDSSFAVVEKGGKKDNEGKTVPRTYRHLPYKDASGKIDMAHLRNALARMNQVQASSPSDSTERIRAVAKRVLVAAAKKHLPNSQFAKESLDYYEETLAGAGCEDKEDKEDKESKGGCGGGGGGGGGGGKKAKKSGKKKAWAEFAARDIIGNVKTGKLALVTEVAEAGIKVVLADEKEFKEVSLSDVAELENWIVLANADTNAEGPISLKEGLTILPSEAAVASISVAAAESEACLFTSFDKLTEEGTQFVKDRFMAVVAGKAIARLNSVDVFQTIEFVSLTISEEEEDEFGIRIVLEVGKDSKGGVVYVRILSDAIPADALADVAKYLKSLPIHEYESPATASLAVPDQATAPAKLDRCVRDVTKSRTAAFRKKAGRAPTAKEKKEIVSSAWAICQSAMKNAQS